MSSEIQQHLDGFFSEQQSDARRIFHGRGQFFPGWEHVVIDWFEPLVLITAYKEIDDAQALSSLIKASDKLKQIGSIVLQMRYQQGAPTEVLFGEELPTLIVRENSLIFEVHPGQQQNTGLFLDMRLVREYLLENSLNKNVLNLFAYTCSLSVAAMAGGARHVTNVDISKTSIKWGEKNHDLNNQPMRDVKSIPYNLFRSWGRIKQYGRYDLVIIDPPTRQHGSFDVEKNYAAVLRKLPKLCSAGAEVIATVNSPFLETDFLLEKFSENVPGSKYLGSMAAAPEFEDKYPEKALKIYRFSMPDTAIPEPSDNKEHRGQRSTE